MNSSEEEGNIGSGSDVCDLRSEDFGDGELNGKPHFQFLIFFKNYKEKKNSKSKVMIPGSPLMKSKKIGKSTSKEHSGMGFITLLNTLSRQGTGVLHPHQSHTLGSLCGVREHESITTNVSNGQGYKVTYKVV
jgi:hypothetical protein